MFDCQHITFSGHAIQRMFQRGISKPDVLSIIASGETIAEYPDDTPYPSLLLCGFVDNRPLHVVVAFHEAVHACTVVTTYIPSADQWTTDFRTRRT
ncbi:MAG: DUF4258 domain-containing protein [Thermodesulfobacteriota bacterium]